MRPLLIVLLILGTAWWKTYGRSARPLASEKAAVQIDHDAAWQTYLATRARRLAREASGRSLPFAADPRGDRNTASAAWPTEGLWCSRWSSVFGGGDTEYARIVSTTPRGLATFVAYRTVPGPSSYPTVEDLRSETVWRFMLGKVNFAIRGRLLHVGDEFEWDPSSGVNPSGPVHPAKLLISRWSDVSSFRLEASGDLSVNAFSSDPDSRSLKEPRHYRLLIRK